MYPIPIPTSPLLGYHAQTQTPTDSRQELKQDEWDNRMKLSNQYRGLDTEEMAFLSDKIQERRAVERKNEEEDNREVRSYRE
jgi:hypothetical protein